MATIMSLTGWRADSGAEQPFGAPGRKSGKPFPARMDVEDSIECADLGRPDQVGQVDEVAVQIGDATVVAVALALLARRVEVGSGGVNRGRAASRATRWTGSDSRSSLTV
jgi:hypothetical protein